MVGEINPVAAPIYSVAAYPRRRFDSITSAIPVLVDEIKNPPKRVWDERLICYTALTIT